MTTNEELGYIKSIPENKYILDNTGLFAKWYEKSRSKNERLDSDNHVAFVSDGLLAKPGVSDIELDELWKSSPIRIAFMIKDQNQGKGTPWIEDLREWCIVNSEYDTTPKKIQIKEKNWALGRKTLRNIANVCWGVVEALHGNFPSSSAAVSSTNFHNVLSNFHRMPIALCECKKQPGGANITDGKLKYYILLYRELLCEQLDILNANCYICSHWLIYNFVKEYLLEKFPGSSFLYSDEDVSIHDSGAVLLKGYHPTARTSYEAIYDSYKFSKLKFSSND